MRDENFWWFCIIIGIFKLVYLVLVKDSERKKVIGWINIIMVFLNSDLLKESVIIYLNLGFDVILGKICRSIFNME